MKKMFVIAALLVSSSTLFAQQQVLFDGSVDVSGYGGAGVRVAQINKSAGLLVGASGAVLLDHRYSVGLAGYGLTNLIHPNVAGGDSLRLDLGYGGATVGYTLFPDDVVHVGAGVFLGAGAVDYSVDRPRFSENHRGTLDVADAFWVVEPSVSVEVNLLRNIRVRVDGSYRFVDGIESSGLTNDDVSGPAGGLSVMIGSF